MIQNTAIKKDDKSIHKYSLNETNMICILFYTVYMDIGS